MKIGKLSSHTGLNASAIRYYERLGLVPAPHRSCGQRRYSDEAAHRLLLIRFAKDMDFTLGEIKVFLSGLRDKAPVGPRWRKLAHLKINEVDEKMQRSRKLKSLLKHMLECHCASLQVCVERLSLSSRLKDVRGGYASKKIMRGSALRS
jgi:MerR family transcriptional regulator, redox-sensitive transcriptional activator SoxR